MHNSKAVGKGPIVAMSFQWSTRLELIRFDSIRFDSIRFGFVSQVGGATLRIEIGGGGRRGFKDPVDQLAWRWNSVLN